MRNYLRTAFAIYAKDVRLEARTKETVATVLVFALIVAIVFNFTFDPSPGDLALVGPGIVWVAFIFAGILGMNRTFVAEHDRGTLDALRLAPVGKEALYLGKLLGALTVMLVVEALMLPVFLVLYDLWLFTPLFLLTAVLATVGFASVGTLFSAIAVHTRAREVLLPVLLLPAVLPVIMASVFVTGTVVEGGGEGAGRWLQLMVAYNVLFLVLSSWAFEYVLEE
ncbi:MAG: heme exporter protein CcmB [Dehalococcoidia bacterium]